MARINLQAGEAYYIPWDPVLKHTVGTFWMRAGCEVSIRVVVFDEVFVSDLDGIDVCAGRGDLAHCDSGDD